MLFRCHLVVSFVNIFVYLFQNRTFWLCTCISCPNQIYPRKGALVMKVQDKIKVRVEIIDIPGNAGHGIDQVLFFYDVLSIGEAILVNFSKIFAFQQRG